MHHPSRRSWAPALAAGLFLVASAGAASAGDLVPIHDVQYTLDPSGASPYEGQEVTVTGVVTATVYYGYFVSDAPGPWSSVFVYGDRDGPEVGDEVLLTGTVEEYYGMTEISDVSAFELLSSGHPVTPLVLPVVDVSQEMYESVLVALDDVHVAALLDFGEWAVTDGAAYALCDDINDFMYFPKVGDELDLLTGVVAYTFGAFKLEPRSTDDIAWDGYPHYALHGHVVTMDDDRTVLFDGYVEIYGEHIMSVGPRRPEGLDVITVGGLIFPGLIDAHNHLRYNVLDVIPFDRLFEDRDEWHADPLYAQFGAQFAGIRDHGGDDAQLANLLKLAELRALTSGTTMIQGTNCNGDYYHDFARQGVVIDNAERFPARIYSDTFPLDDTPLYWQYLSGRYWDRFVIHLSEGVNADALAEFYQWQGWGMLDERTTIIHGVPYGAAEWDAMAAAGASLVWSPTSNMRLYGATADVPGALAAGVTVALAPDWTESGARTVLDEIHAAEALDEELWGDAITPQQMVELVTRNAAHVLAADDLVGQVTPGHRANLMVIAGNPAKPYHSLVRAEPRDVKLTVVNGRPMYGDPGLMKRFPGMSGVERLRVGGRWKSLSIQLDAHGVPEGDKPCLQLLDELEQAWLAVEPKVCEFLGIE
jgi:hypothetical protein